MPFSAELSALCSMLNRTNKDIAQKCGISGSALSRYRNGEREPKPNSRIVRKLANGLAALGKEEGLEGFLDENEILLAFNSSLLDPVVTGKRLCSRFRRLVMLLKIHNAEVAQALDVDSSYVSRIRNGQRFPSDRVLFAEAVAEIAAKHYYLRGEPADLATVLTEECPDQTLKLPPQEDSVELEEILTSWLLGEELVDDSTAEAELFFDRLSTFNQHMLLDAANRDAFVYEGIIEKTTVARFYNGISALRTADLDLLRLSVADPETKHIVFQSDMPVSMKNADSSFLRIYSAGISALLEKGVRITIVHNVNRPFSAVAEGILYWLPAYMTGMVEPRYICGVHNRVFCHMNAVSDSVALSGEMIVGHESDGRAYLTNKPDEVAYYRRKMDYILENTLPLMDVYRIDQPERMAIYEEKRQQLEKAGRGRHVARGRFENIEIVAYGPDCVVVTKTDDPVMHVVVHHPKICHALSSIDASGE